MARLSSSGSVTILYLVIRCTDPTDVRYTSCTTTGMTIFNRHTEAVFSNALARMQPCSNGLRELFGTAHASSKLVNLLSLSLLQPDNGLPKRPTPYRSLNLIPSYAALIPAHLPNPSSTSTLPRWQPTRTETTAYLAGGVGQLYGAGVGNMADEVRMFRQDVTTSLYMQALEEGLHDESDSDKEDRWWEKKSKAKKKAKVYKRKPAAGDADKSKMFVAGSQGRQEVVDVENHKQGIKEQMMVRVAQDGWERLTWSVGNGNAVVKAEIKKTGQKSDLVSDIMSATSSSSSSSSSKKQASTPSTSRQTPSAKNKPTPPGANLFRPMVKAPTSAFPVSKPSVSATIFASMPKRASSNPFNTPGSRSSNAFGVQPLSSSPVEPTSSVESKGFGTTGKKRTWGGVAEEGAKRRGMKMFSGARM